MLHVAVQSLVDGVRCGSGSAMEHVAHHSVNRLNECVGLQFPIGCNKGIQRHDIQRALEFRVLAIYGAQYGPDLVCPPLRGHCCELLPLCTSERSRAARRLAVGQRPTLRDFEDKVDNARVLGTHCI